MSTTDGRRGHYNSAAQTAAVRESIRGREDEVTRLIWWHLIHWHVPEPERAEYAQRCWLRALERTSPWDESKGALITWVRWIVMAEVTHGRRRTHIERKAFIKPVHGRDGEVDHLDERGVIGRHPDPRPPIDEYVSAHEARVLVQQILDSIGGIEPGQKGWMLALRFGDDQSCTEVAKAMSLAGVRTIGKSGVQHHILDSMARMRAWLQSHPAIAEELHASLA